MQQVWAKQPPEKGRAGGNPNRPRQPASEEVLPPHKACLFCSLHICIFMKEHAACQLHCHLSLDNLLTSRILECQPGCLYNCRLCQNLCEKCHWQNEVRKQSCSMFLTRVTTTESITCFQDSFENISSSCKKRCLWNWKSEPADVDSKFIMRMLI